MTKFYTLNSSIPLVFSRARFPSQSLAEEFDWDLGILHTLLDNPRE